MGTKVQLDNHFPGHDSMRDLSRDSNGGSWPSYYGENNFPNGQHYYGFSPRIVAESFPGYDREVLKQKMLEHEGIFKNQVYELHRLYRVQRELMDEVKRNGQCKQGIPYETSSSSSPLPPQMQSDAPKWNASSFPSSNHVSGGQPITGSDVMQSSANAMKVGSSMQAGPIPFQSCSSPKGSVVSDSRPTKFRRTFDLELPAGVYIDTDEVEQCRDGKASGSYNHLRPTKFSRMFDLELPAGVEIATDEVEQFRDGKASGSDNHLRPLKKASGSDNYLRPSKKASGSNNYLQPTNFSSMFDLARPDGAYVATNEVEQRRDGKTSGSDDHHRPIKASGSDNHQQPTKRASGSDNHVQPTKFSRMFDLAHPDGVYIAPDEVEQCRDGKVSGSDYHLPVDRDCRHASASGAKLFPSHSERVECNEEAQGSSLRKSVALADLNEPVPVEETNGADFLSTATCDEYQPRGQSSKFHGLPTDAVQNHRHGNINGTSNTSHFDYRGDKPGWFSYMIDSEKNKANMRFIDLGVQSEKAPTPSQPVQLLLDQAHQPAGFPPNDHIKGDSWRPKISSGLETSNGSYYLSHVPSPPSFIHSSDLGNSWEHSVTSWGRPGGSSQRSTSVQANPFLASANFSRSSQPYNTPSNEVFGSIWHLNGNARPTSGFGTELPLRNGFYQGCSSSVFKEPAVRFPTIGSDHAGSSNNDKSALGSSNLIKAQTGIDVNTREEFNLNVTQHPNGFSDKWITQRGVKITESVQKQEDTLAALPWLRSNGASLNESLTSRKCSNSLESGLVQGPTDAGKGFDCQRSVGPTMCDVYAKVNRHEITVSSSNKIMGVPILGKPSMLKNEASSAVIDLSSGPHLSGDEEIQRRGKKRVLDMNAPCDSTDLESSDSADDDALVVVQKETDNKTPSIRNHFDLNSCIIEDEEVLPGTSLVSGSATTSTNVGTGIDLEAPVVIEDEYDDSMIEGSASVQQPKLPSELTKQRADMLGADTAKSAAEAIVAISSITHQKLAVEDITLIQVEAPAEDPLNWFVDIASSCAGDIERQLELALWEENGVGNDDDCLSTESDYFESMTLKLTECTAEEYMPKPFIPELPKIEDTRISAVGTRSRRGQSRRGRQRRDFQRDILPGLTSLSRNEVTEDLQKFGGLMRATGHAWQSGPRRNATKSGRGRGRRKATAAMQPSERTTCAPLKQQLNTEVALGWGKTTRRPRRQRCPAGNLTTVTLT